MEETSKKVKKQKSKEVSKYEITKPNGSVISKIPDVMNKNKIDRYKSKGWKVKEVF